MTIPTIKTNTNTDIRTKTTASSITRANVADLFDALADEILARGIKGVADTTALSALTGTDNKNAIVADNGIWQYASSGTPNGTTIFSASGGGVWVRIFANQDITGKQDTLVSGTNLKTINSTSLLGSGNINTATDISGKQDTLVSGTNIKTINSMSLLGSGNIDIVTADEIEEYDEIADFPGTGSGNILYVALDTDFLYRWSGSTYTQVGGGSAGSQTLDQVLTEGNIANLLYTDVNYKYTNWVVPTSTPLNSTFGVNIKKITPSEYGTNATVGLWSESIGEYQSGQEGSPTARKNVVWSWGYNIDQGIANEGYMRFGMESNYRPGGGAEWFEWHAPEVMTRDGAINRWYSVTGSKATPQATHTFRGNTLQFVDIADPSIQLFGFDGSNWGLKGDYFRFTNKTADRSSLVIQTTEVDLYMLYGVGTAGAVFENYGTAWRNITSPRNNFGGQVWTDKYFNANTVASQKIYAATNGGGDLFSITANAANTGVSVAFANSAFYISAEDGSSNPLFRVLSNSYANYFNVYNDGHVTIGTASPAASSILDITSTTKGFLPPRMTKTQRDAISSPATGLLVYQTDNTPGLRCYNGTNWMRYTETAD